MENKNACLFVSNVPYKAEKEDITEFFTEKYNLVDIYLPKYLGSNRKKGIAFVTFETVEDATDALETMDDQKLMGRTIKLSYSQTKRRTREEMEKRNRGERRGPSRYEDRNRGGYCNLGYWHEGSDDERGDEGRYRKEEKRGVYSPRQKYYEKEDDGYEERRERRPRKADDRS